MENDQTTTTTKRVYIRRPTEKSNIKSVSTFANALLAKYGYRMTATDKSLIEKSMEIISGDYWKTNVINQHSLNILVNISLKYHYYEDTTKPQVDKNNLECRITEYKGHQILKITRIDADENSFELSFGIRKAKLITLFANEIKKFAESEIKTVTPVVEPKQEIKTTTVSYGKFPMSLIGIMTGKGIKAMDLINRVGISKESLSDWMMGDQLPTIEETIKMSKFLKVDPTQIMGD